MVKELVTYLRGWLGYFGDCQTPSVLQTLEKWLRCRLRSVVWKQWKRGRTTFRELRQLARTGHCVTECLLCWLRASAMVVRS
jgi:hypothetical protein